ncbi:MAG: UrcA family protein, partial [Steroidobacteraceae bacterium]
NDAPQVVVKYGDLNLSNPQGAATLYHRIKSAAVTVCSPQDESLARMSRVQACVHKAIADAVTKVNQAELSAIYNSKNHEQRPIVLAQGR